MVDIKNIRSEDYILIESLINKFVSYYILTGVFINDGGLYFNRFYCYDGSSFNGYFNNKKDESLDLDRIILLKQGTFDNCKMELYNLVEIKNDIKKYNL